MNHQDVKIAALEHELSLCKRLNKELKIENARLRFAARMITETIGPMLAPSFIVTPDYCGPDRRNASNDRRGPQVRQA